MNNVNDIFKNALKAVEPESKTQAYQILEFIKANYSKNELDILEEFIQDTFPKDWEKFQSDNYDGPSEIDYDVPTQGEIQERMARVQRELK